MQLGRWLSSIASAHLDLLLQVTLEAREQDLALRGLVPIHQAWDRPLVVLHLPDISECNNIITTVAVLSRTKLNSTPPWWPTNFASIDLCLTTDKVSDRQKKQISL